MERVYSSEGSVYPKTPCATRSSSASIMAGGDLKSISATHNGIRLSRPNSAFILSHFTQSVFDRSIISSKLYCIRYILPNSTISMQSRIINNRRSLFHEHPAFSALQNGATRKRSLTRIDVKLHV